MPPVNLGVNGSVGMSSVLSAPPTSVADTLAKLATVRDDFCRDYRVTLQALSATDLPFAVCTIYDVRYPDLAQRRVAVAALALINDCIIREAAAAAFPSSI